MTCFYVVGPAEPANRTGAPTKPAFSFPAKIANRPFEKPRRKKGRFWHYLRQSPGPPVRKCRKYRQDRAPAARKRQIPESGGSSGSSGSSPGPPSINTIEDAAPWPRHPRKCWQADPGRGAVNREKSEHSRGSGSSGPPRAILHVKTRHFCAARTRSSRWRRGFARGRRWKTPTPAGRTGSSDAEVSCFDAQNGPRRAQTAGSPRVSIVLPVRRAPPGPLVSTLSRMRPPGPAILVSVGKRTPALAR